MTKSKNKFITNKEGCYHCNAYIEDADKNLQCLSVSIASDKYEVRREIMDDKNYIVVPAVFMVEGVHSGSNGPTLYTANELKKFPEAWNGRPMPVYHPENELGPIPANQPKVLEARSIGFVFNAFYNDDKKHLAGEFWINEEKAKKISPKTLAMIDAKEMIEISTGVFTEDEDVSGTFDGLVYNSIARNMRPDHIAVLPEGKGACSIDKGCGIRANEEKAKININKLKTLSEYVEMDSKLTANEIDYAAVINKIRNIVCSWDQDSLYASDIYSYFNLTKLTETYIIIENTTMNATKYYRMPYSVDEKGNVSVASWDKEEVAKNISFDSLSPEKDNIEKLISNNDNKNITKGNVMKKKEIIQNLVANKNTKFTSADTEMLEALEVNILEKMIPVVNEEIKVEEKKFTANDAMALLKNEFSTPEKFINVVPAEYRETFSNGLRLHNEKKIILIDKIVANTRYTKEMLDSKPVLELEIIADGVTPTVNNIFNTDVPVVNRASVSSSDDEPLMPFMA